jgi:hypothetical protein
VFASSAVDREFEPRSGQRVSDCCLTLNQPFFNYIMARTSYVDREFEPRSGQTKDYKIGICCFSAKHAALRRKNKEWLAQNQNNVRQQYNGQKKKNKRTNNDLLDIHIKLKIK